MRMKILVACLVFALQLSAQTSSNRQGSKKPAENEASTMRQMQAHPAPSAQTTAPDQLSGADKSFLKALIEEDISEIGLAKMALDKSANADVKNYAQTKILAADPQMRDGAEAIARKYAMPPPSQPNGTQREIFDKLDKKSGKDFDTAYMVYEATQQTDDVKLVDAELSATNNPEVKNYVAKEKAPVVEAAQSAKEISAKLAGEMRAYRQPASGGRKQ